MNHNMSRLGIFVFFDPQGIVDDYVVYLLRAFRPHFRRMVVVSNSALDQTARDRLLQYSDDLLIRENHGLDAAAYKEGLISHCGWEEVQKYDEVVLMNDTFFGPIHSFDDMFTEMSGKDLDFWGMSAGYHTQDWWKKVRYKYIPNHIQTFFIAFRKQMVNTDVFRSYWDSYDETLNDFISVVTQNEVVLTKHFQDLGFRWDIYAQTHRYCSDCPRENFNLYHCHADTMMSEMGFPVLKRKSLNVNFYDSLSSQDISAAADAMAYIHNKTDYDTAMIWDNVLRLYNITDLYESLHLNFVLPSIPTGIARNDQIALVYRVSNPFFAGQFCRHALQMCDCVHVYMIPESEAVGETIRQELGSCSRITLLNSSRQKTEMGAFLLCCRQLAEKYEYLGYIHDAENTDHAPPTVIESTVYGYLQNVANDPAYVSQVINCFEQNPKLGVLGVPFPIHGHGFANYSDMWNGCYQEVCKLSRELDLSCNLNQEKPPFMTVGSFWCRTAAIRSIWNKQWAPGHFPVNPVTRISRTNDTLIRLLPYAAQSERYHSGIVMHTNYASMRITGQQYMLSQIVRTTENQLGCSSSRYLKYLDQLQSISIRTEKTDSPVIMDLSHFSILRIIRIYLDRHMPSWISPLINRIIARLETLRYKLRK